MQVFFVCLIVVFIECTSSSVPFLEVVGSHYEIGHQVGQSFSAQINSFVSQYSYLNEILLPYYKSESGRKVFDDLLNINSALYPQYLEELRGLANGSNIPLNTLLLLNFRYEMGLWINNSTQYNSNLNCADIHVCNEENILVAHNEDAAPGMEAFLLHIIIPDTAQDFFAFTYPGYLSGVAFGWNKFLTLSFNFVYPTTGITTGAARAFINRDALGATSVSDAISRITPEGRAFGYTLHLGNIAEKRSYCIEVSPSAYTFWEIRQNFSHFNEYKILNVPQLPDTSSTHRQLRTDEMPIPKTPEDALAILGDNQDRDWPIYRTGNPPDHVVTVATVLFDLSRKHVSVWAQNPKFSNAVYNFEL